MKDSFKGISLANLCAWFGLTRQAYYQSKNRVEKDLIEAELTQERYRELAIRHGENVFIYPRNVRVFLNT
jgi:hypothetical protein